MKKSIARGSMLAVAALSLLLGGTSYTTSVKDKVAETPAIVGKAIANNASDADTLSKGTAVQTVAENTTEVETTAAATEQETTEQPVQITEKKAQVGSNQVVANIDSYLNIRAEASEDADVIGKFYTGNVGTLVEKGDEWSVVASGNAYGYVKNDYLLFGSDAEQYIENNCDQVAKVTADTLNVRADESTESEVVTQADEGNSFTMLGQDNGWVKVAVSEDQVGYVSSDYVYLDYVYETAVTVEEEQAAEAAKAEQEQAAAETTATESSDNSASSDQTTTEAPSTQAPATEAPSTQAPATEAPSTQAPATEAPTTQAPANNTASSTGQAIANFAVQFVGNPYVYGGTSLTNGADCSGFVQSVFKNFGYQLPRVAADQANAGSSVSVDSLQPGDLLFYHGFGHVAIYIGGGQVVHASNRATGIKISAYNYSPIDRAVRIAY